MAHPTTASASRILSAAVIKTADIWELTDQQLARILGLSLPDITQLRAGDGVLESDSQPFEAGRLLIRLFKKLDGLMGSDDRASISWLHAVNLDLGACPLERMQSRKGMREVFDYLDSYRRTMGLEDFSEADLAALAATVAPVECRGFDDELE